MNSIVIVEAALREFLNDAMSSSSSNSHLSKSMPVRINPVVAPDAPEVDPINTNFMPQNKAELLSALRAMCCDIEDENAPAIYVAIEDAVKTQEEEMPKQPVEEIVRLSVKKILKDLSESKQSKDEDSVRMRVRSIMEQIIQEAPPPKMPKGSPDWNPATYVPPPAKKPRMSLSPVKKAPRTPEEQKAAYEKNVAQLQDMFSGGNLSKALGTMQDEKSFVELVGMAEKYAEVKAALDVGLSLVDDTVASSYKDIFQAFKEASEETPGTPVRASYLISSDGFSEAFEEETGEKFIPFLTKLGTQVENAIADSLESIKSGKRKYTKGSAATLRDVANAIEKSIASVKKIQPVALGKYMLGMKSGIAGLIPDVPEVAAGVAQSEEPKLSFKSNAAIDAVDSMILDLQGDEGIKEFEDDLKILLDVISSGVIVDGKETTAYKQMFSKNLQQHYDALKQLIDQEMDQTDDMSTALIVMRGEVEDYITSILNDKSYKA